MKTDQKTLEAVFATEGIGLRLSNVHLQEDIPESVSAKVYPQDIVDAVRDMRRGNLLEEGKKTLSSSDRMRLIRYDLKLDSQSSEQGRVVPKLQLQLVKNQRNIHGQIIYHWDNQDHYFAYFDL